MDRVTDGWTDKQKFPCDLQDFVPFGVAAQKASKMLDFPLFQPLDVPMDRQTNGWTGKALYRVACHMQLKNNLKSSCKLKDSPTDKPLI